MTAKTTNQTPLRDRMLAVMTDVNAQVAEREELVELIKECVYADRVQASFLLPYDKGGIVSYFMENATVLEQEYREDGVWIRVSCHKSDADKYSVYQKSA